MKNSSLKELLKAFMSGQITPEDFRRLKKNTLQVFEKELDEELQSAWNDYGDATLMDPEIKTDVLTTIYQQIRTEDRYSSALHGRLPASGKDWSNSEKRFSTWRQRPFVLWMQKAAVFLLPILISLASYLYFSNRHKPVFVEEEFVVVAESGNKTKLLLPDGTWVWLNSDSKLIYTSGFNRNNRNVKLEGEAFFDVTRDADVRFTVETGCMNVVVHGTAFNVSAYAADTAIYVSLLRGKIILENNADNQMLTELSPDQSVTVSKEEMKWVMMELKPDQMASVSKETMVCTVRPCDAATESLWTQNKLKFENAHAAEVYRKLERWYGVRISVENMHEDIFYGFTLKSETLREILDEMNKITPFIYDVNGEEVNISYK